MLFSGYGGASHRWAQLLLLILRNNSCANNVLVVLAPRNLILRLLGARVIGVASQHEFVLHSLIASLVRRPRFLILRKLRAPHLASLFVRVLVSLRETGAEVKWGRPTAHRCTTVDLRALLLGHLRTASQCVTRV